MKWPLVKSKFYINKLFSQQLSHLLIDSIWKEPILTVPGIWPLCYSWIGYLQANGPPWVLLSFYVDHDFSCRQSEAANNSNLKSYWLLPDTDTKEYAKPLQIDNLVFDQANRRVLNDLKQGDQITVLLDKKQNVISMEYQGRYVLTYEDYAAEHENNNTVGVIVTLILSCASWGLIIFLIVHYIKTGRVSDVLPRRF